MGMGCCQTRTFELVAMAADGLARERRGRNGSPLGRLTPAALVENYLLCGSDSLDSVWISSRACSAACLTSPSCS